MDIDLKLLQYAVVLSRHRHFGRAAASLRISQPTLSRNIAALEKQVGMRVFERSRRDVVATPVGEDVLKMADELVARAEALSSSLQLVRDGKGGRLRVAAGPFPHDIAVRPAAVELIKANPSLRLELLEREWAATLAMLMTDRVDFAVLDIEALKGIPTLKVELLGRLEGTYFCRAGHPLLMRKNRAAVDVRKFPFVFASIAQDKSGLLADIDPGHSVDPASGDILPSIAVSTFATAKEIVLGSDAISLGHVSQIRGDLVAGRLSLLDLPWRKQPVAQLGVAWKRDRSLPPAARRLIDAIRARLRPHAQQ